MKKSNRVSNVWSTAVNSTRNTGPRTNAHTKTNTTKTKGTAKTTLSTATHNKEQDSVKNAALAPEDLEEDLDREKGTVSLVDKEEETKEEKTKSWADIVREHQLQSTVFSETVSMQGLAPIFDPKSSLKRKLTWFTIVFVAVIFTGFNIYTQIIMYVHKPISVRVDFCKANDLDFPTVTLCNNNFAGYVSTASFNAVDATMAVKPLLFTSEKIEPDFSHFDFSKYRLVGWDKFFTILAQNMSQLMLRPLLGETNGEDLPVNSHSEDFIIEVNLVLAAYEMAKPLAIEYIIRHLRGNARREVLLRDREDTNTPEKCQWEQTTCTLANFTPIFTDMGLCYSFNVNGTFKAREAGRSYGLKLTLDTMQDDYLRSLDHYYGAGFRVSPHVPTLDSLVKNNESVLILIRVVVHSSSVPPIMSEKGVAVSPGLHNFLAIDVKHLKNAKPSVSHCGSKALRYYRGTYSTEACRLECRADYINRSCGCRDTYMPNLHVRICDPPEFHSCIYPMMDEYLKQNTACEDLCPEPCSENLYQVTPSSNPFSQRFLQEFSQLTNKSADYWRQNLLHLEIYLTSMTYEKVEKQLSYTLLQLFCDVGGAFGLLLGASILTLLEIVDFFLCRLSTNSAARGGRGGGIGGGGGGVGGGIGGEEDEEEEEEEEEE
ncbi:hypothetical protein ACOMHN_001196 [Nucella lapillus]